MDSPLIGLVRAARSAGLRVSPAESMDAVRAAAAVGWADREGLRRALAMTLAKSVAEKARFDTVFDLFFAGSPRVVLPDARPAADPGAAPEGQGGSALGRMLAAGDTAGLALALDAAAAALRAEDIRVFTQVNPLARRMLERIGLDALDIEIAARGDTPAGDALRAGRDALAHAARAIAERNLALFAAGESRAWRDRRLAETPLAALDRRDQARVRVLARALARRLATRHGARRQAARRGALDAPRTLRRNLGWGGVPFRTVHRRRRVDRPRLLVLCDVSGSVAAAAGFLLLILHALREVLADLRAFAFSAVLAEVTDTLARQPAETAIPAIVREHGWGSTNYGRALEGFARDSLARLDPCTTVIILGDGRGNRTEPRVDLLAAIAQRCRGVVWLNPEPRTLWGSGDSDMLRYAVHCRLAAPCATLAALERVVEGLLERR